MSSAEVSLEEGGVGRNWKEEKEDCQGNLSSRRALCDKCSLCYLPNIWYHEGDSSQSIYKPCFAAQAKGTVICLLCQDLGRGWAQLCAPQSWAPQRRQGVGSAFTFCLGRLGVLLGDLHRHSLHF